MAAHALLSASGASRWLACPPSARLEENFPNTSNIYAKEGTLAHRLGELIITYNLRRMTKKQLTAELAEIKKDEHYSAEMHDYCDSYAAYIWEEYNAAKAKTKDSLIFLEEELDFRKYVPEGFGTGDVVIISDGILNIIDLKYGKSPNGLVSAENNKQMMLYALGALNKYDLLYDIDCVAMTIYQPRLDNISTWHISVKSLMQWAMTELKEKAALAYDGAGDFVTGDHCRFCRARAVCRALAEENLKLARYDFKPADILSNEEIADILLVSERLTNWANDVSAYALDQAVNHGVKFKGFKVVEGRSNRAYTDEDLVSAKLIEADYKEEEIYIKKILGITAMEKLLGKTKFNSMLSSYLIKPPGKPTLVLETDRRPEFTGIESAKNDFNDGYDSGAVS